MSKAIMSKPPLSDTKLLERKRASSTRPAYGTVQINKQLAKNRAVSPKPGSR
jgi:hypothetical protein